MSITTEIVRLQNCVSNAYAVCNNKGATMPVTQNSDALSTTIQSINATFVEPSEVAKYRLENYSEQINEITARATDVTLSGKFEDIDEIKVGFNGAFRTTIVTYNNVEYLPRRKVHGNITFTKLKKVSAMYEVFYCCEFDQNCVISFPALKVCDSFYETFRKTKNLHTVSFGALETITVDWSKTFYESDVVNVLFPALTTIDTNGGFWFQAFYGCTNITTMSFPMLTTINTSYAFYKTNYGAAFSGCTNLTAIHFKASMQSVIENLDGYSSAFGATNATIYFDL